MDDDKIIKARLKDLANRAYNQNIYTYSNFLNPAELALLDDIRPEISFVDITTSGGNELCERQMVQFGSERMFGYEGSWPISVIRIEPLLDKFADDLNHRDFLGALMNLGIERSVMGDILVKQKKAYCFCEDSIADFIVDNLTKVKHTNVRCTVLESIDDANELKPELVPSDVIVASPRFDAIIAALTKNSRTATIALFQGQKVTLNGRICERNSMQLKDGDTFAVRGYGKFRFVGVDRETRKGRIYVKIETYR